MKQYFTGFFTGACLVVSAVMFMGASDKNLGDIVVNSITVMTKDDGTRGSIEIIDKNGKVAVGILSGSTSGGNIYISNRDGEYGTIILPGSISTYNDDVKETVLLGTAHNGSGFIKTFDADETEKVFLGAAVKGHGLIKTYDSDEKIKILLGAIDNSGAIILNDSDGMSSGLDSKTFRIWDRGDDFKDYKERAIFGVGKIGPYLMLSDSDGMSSSLDSKAFRTWNSDGKPTTFLGVDLDSSLEGAFLKTFNDGQETVFVGTGDHSGGMLTISNSGGNMVGAFGVSPDDGKDGAAILLDRYGDAGWSASGKQ
tara:strand:+ start:58 stop:990 length:933 start_codon:yes stop_codon:yes gene_type:complete